VLVQPEMESSRFPLVKYTVIFGGAVGSTPANAVAAGGTDSGPKLQLVSKSKLGWVFFHSTTERARCRLCAAGLQARLKAELILQWKNQTGYEKNLESTPRQVFQQAACQGIRPVQEVPTGRG
jgi:hypothetical protein